jgi:hypothetical protein
MDWRSEVDMAKVDIRAAVNSGEMREETAQHLRDAVKHLLVAIEELDG